MMRNIIHVRFIFERADFKMTYACSDAVQRESRFAYIVYIFKLPCVVHYLTAEVSFAVLSESMLMAPSSSPSKPCSQNRHHKK